MQLLLSGLWAALVAWLIARAVRQSRLLRELAPAPWPEGGPAPAVVAIVPARDEGANIGACVDGLLAQAYPEGRLSAVVVDDGSADDTAAIVRRRGERDLRLRLMESSPLPPGWLGKSHACWQGTRAVPGTTEWLCFLDADVRVDPLAMASAVAAAEAEGLDLLSLTPRHELGSFAERLMIPCGLYTLAFCQDLAALQAHDGPGATATGQFMLVRRVAYEAVGGHAAIRAAIAEDVALAVLLKRSGRRVALLNGERLVSSRMYTGWRSLWPGFAKNLVDMLGGPVSTAGLALLALMLAWISVLLPIGDAVAIARGVPLADAALGLAAAGSLAMLGLHLAGAVRLGIPFWYGLLYPVGYSIGALMALDSVRRRLTGRATWKGRLCP